MPIRREVPPSVGILLDLLAVYSLLVFCWGLAARGLRSRRAESADAGNGEGGAEEPVSEVAGSVRVLRGERRTRGGIEGSSVASTQG